MERQFVPYDGDGCNWQVTSGVCHLKAYRGASSLLCKQEKRSSLNMKALELSREYFRGVAEPSLKQDFPDLYPRLAAGLVGNGSECYGYDDELSRDHDWGVDFFIWTGESDSGKIPQLQEWKNRLIENHPPDFPRARSEYGANVSVMTCSSFYRSIIGSPCAPQTINEWLRAPEENYSLVTNGEVFIDGTGEFTGIRNDLLGYYPEDIRLKRIASKCMLLAQSGQYNHERTAKRGDWVTLRTVISRFTDHAIAMVFLLNKTFRPYYKWAFRAMKELPIIGSQAARLLLLIAETGSLDEGGTAQRQKYMSELCGIFIRELETQNLAQSDDWFLTTQGEEVQSLIVDEFLRSLPTQYEI